MSVKSPNRPYKPIDLIKRTKIIQMAIEDNSIHSISKELQIARETVKKYLKEDKIEELEESIKDLPISNDFLLKLEAFKEKKFKLSR